MVEIYIIIKISEMSALRCKIYMQSDYMLVSFTNPLAAGSEAGNLSSARYAKYQGWRMRIIKIQGWKCQRLLKVFAHGQSQRRVVSTICASWFRTSWGYCGAIHFLLAFSTLGSCKWFELRDGVKMFFSRFFVFLQCFCSWRSGCARLCGQDKEERN